MGSPIRALERSLVLGFTRWKRAKSDAGRRNASALIESALLNLDVMLGRGDHFRLMLRRGRLDLGTVERWLATRK